MKKRIGDKICEISKFLDELSNILPSNFDEYKANLEKKAACERYFEKIVEAVTDTAFLIIKFNKFKIPQDDIDAFTILLENKVIDISLATKLKNAKGMRNIIAHEYGAIDDELVFDSITEEFEIDINKFISLVKELFKEKSDC